MKSILPRSTVAATFCAAAIIISTHTAAAQENVERSGTFENTGGGSGTFDQTVNRQPGQTTHDLEWYNLNGGHGSRRGITTGNKATGIGTRRASTTLTNGKTVASEGKTKKTSTGLQSSGTHTGPYKKTSTIERTMTKTGRGSATVGTTITRPKGNSTTVHKTGTKTHGGHIPRGTFTGPYGGNAAFDKDVTRTPNADGSVKRTATGTVTDPKSGEHTSDNSGTDQTTSNP